MLVKELIKILQNEDPDDMVILSCDSEGNGFDYVSSIRNGYWDIENYYYYDHLEADDCIWNDPKVVCIWPG